MALIVITVQDTDKGAVVSLAAEPPIDMSAAPVGEAQMLTHLMLGALPMNQPANEGLAEPAKVPVTAKLVAELRAKTDASMMTCKAALVQSNGDMGAAEEAIRLMRVK